MATESIGALVPTAIPGYVDSADIQAALRAYHYGSYDYNPANTSTASLINPSIAYTITNLQSQITAIGATISPTIFTAKGSLITATAASTPVQLSVGGSNGMVLAVNSSTATGLEWQIPAVTLTNSVTLTNKTLTTPIISSISNTGTLTLPTSTDTLVGRATTDTLTNKTLTSPVISTITNTGTLTLPTSTDTLVGRATTDTLTNKTLTSPVISTITNTGTLTLPTSTDTLVGRATTDTLTNKTLTAPIINLSTNAQASSYTLVLSDSSKIVEISNASANTLTIPLNSSVAFPIGSQIIILQTGAGQTTIAGTGGVTVNGTPGLKLRAQFSSATLIKRGTDTWVLLGDLVA